MKLTALLLVVVCMHVSAHSYSQTVSFSGKNVPLSTVFASIEKQTGLSFFFNYALIKDIKPVTLNVQDVPLEEALNEVLHAQGLDYYRTGKTIFIVKKQAVVVEMPASPIVTDANTVNIKGHVINHLGESLPSATVSVKNARKMTLTDAKGNFEIKNVPVGAVLEVSYLGYENKQVEVSRDGEILIQLALTKSQLDAPQVIAYGQTSQRLSTGNITLVKGEDLEKQPVNSPLLALEGRVPGLFITPATGMAGSGVTVRIQGQNSIQNGNDPLYIIDGVPYVSQTLGTTTLGPVGGSGGIAGNGGGNPMNYINTADIESVEVLKDADATAIYGSRAANGAILITTKRGKVGKERVSINFQNGWGGVTRRLPLMNTKQYLQMRYEALQNDEISSPSSYDYDINGVYDTTRYTDWQKELLGGTSQYTNINGSVSGGNLNMQYLVGGTYHRETSVFPGHFNDVKGSLHFNINTVSTSQKFRMQFSGNYLVDNNKLPAADPTSSALSLAPDAPALYKADGSLNWQLLPSGSPAVYNNPAASLYNTYQSKTYNLISNSVISYTVLPGLDVRANLGYTNLRTNEFAGNSILSFNPPLQAIVGTSGRNANYSNSTIESWIIEPQLNYKSLIADGRMEILVGSTINQQNSNGMNLAGLGYNSDALLPDIRSAAKVIVNSTAAAIYKYNAVFGRINYNWKDKYIIDLNVRRDGSSRFGSANQFHNFASAGFAWIFSQEGFIKDNLTGLSFGKLRGSYGTTGSDQITDYRFLDLYNSYPMGVPYQGITGLSATGLPNPYLQWESTRKMQVGIELGFFQNRILLTGNYILNKSSNELVNFPLPTTAGFGSVAENIPAEVQNTAAEIVLNTVNINSKNFGWTSSFNFTIPKNKLLSYFSPNGEIPGNMIIGQPLSITKVFRFAGVDPKTGIYQFLDIHGDLTPTPSSPQDSYVLINSAFPKLYGGLQNTFRYKQFHLDFFFQFTRKITQNSVFGVGFPGSAFSNEPTYVLNRWQKIGDITTIQKYNSNYSLYPQVLNAVNSDASYANLFYARLKTLSVSWNAPSSFLKTMHSQGFNLYLQGQNLLTITKFKGGDPETGGFSLPPLKILTVGAQIEF